MSIVKKFSKAQVASILATVTDFLFLAILVELIGIWSVVATSLSSFVGAIVHFILSRLWVFKARDEDLKIQMIRYTLVAMGSSLLNSFGLYFLNTYFLFPYLISKVITSIFVGVGYNFFFHHYFVFRRT